MTPRGGALSSFIGVITGLSLKQIWSLFSRWKMEASFQGPYARASEPLMPADAPDSSRGIMGMKDMLGTLVDETCFTSSREVTASLDEVKVPRPPS